MNLHDIKRLQKEYGIYEDQQLINSGYGWRMEGSVGRHLMSLLSSGACYLPKKQHRDYYGNIIPSRSELKEGTKGTRKNSINFWLSVEAGEIDL